MIYLSVAILALGALCVWLMYGHGLAEFWKSGDDHAVNVTLIAMFGTYLPVLAVAMLWAFAP